MRGVTLAYLLAINNLLAFYTNFNKWNRIVILVNIIAYCVVSIYENVKSKSVGK